jgi:hypothetical protein
MGDRLASISTLVHHHAIATFFEIEVTGNLGRHHEQVSGQRRVHFINLGDTTDVAHRNDKDVRRCLRGEVVECNGVVITMDDPCRDVAGRDSAENAL